MKSVPLSALWQVLPATWLGFVLAISFMESWLKFRAKGVSLPVGLAIGSIVFKVLNRVEWATAALIAGVLFTGDQKIPPALVALLTLLSFQSFFLLPILGKRARRVIAGEIIPPSPAHRIFIVLELLKVAVLVKLQLDLF